MTSIPCVVKESVVKSERISQGDIHISLIKTGKIPKQPYAIRYLYEGKKFLALSGGFAWPGKMPGAAVVVAVLKTGEDYSFISLDETVHNDIPALILAAYDLYRKWGWNCISVPWRWYGEPVTRFIDFLTKFNQHIPKDVHFRRKFNLMPAAHFEEDTKRSWETLCRSLYALSARKGALITGATPAVRAQLQSLAEQQVFKGTPGDFPNIAAYAYATVTMYERKPWLIGRPKHKLIPTIIDRIEQNYLTPDDLGGFYADEPMEGGSDLKPTVDI